MTLTTVIGSSGSGKTTFLNDVQKSHKCTYIRQYHNMRPYIIVSKIPNFDPTKLPYWSIYVDEGVASSIRVGGTMAGQFIAGLSGGQRKLLLFELICQRVAKQQDMLIVLDEPFAGVTDDFVPYIIERLMTLRQQHNLLVVTNDHVESLTNLADNTIRVSAIDRGHVKINTTEKVERIKAIAALSLGGVYSASKVAYWDDFAFFMDVEVYNNKALLAVSAFTIISFSLFLMSFWGSNESLTALIVVGASMIAFFGIYPYLIALVDWRNAMQEEAEALIHSSKNMNKILKTVLTLTMILAITILQYGVVNAVLDGLNDVKYWAAMFFDFTSLTFYLIALGIFTNLPFEATQILGSIPFVFMIFFSTTFSPGSGLPGVKTLRYLFPRFYFWCMLPGVDIYMEGCPAEDWNMLYLVLSSFAGIFGFVSIKVAHAFIKHNAWKVKKTKRASLMDSGFQKLQIELYGEKVLNRLQGNGSQTTYHSSELVYETISFMEEGRFLMIL